MKLLHDDDDDDDEMIMMMVISHAGSLLSFDGSADACTAGGCWQI